MRPKKALGQHFLTSPPLLEKIAAVTEADAKDVVLEIGPGKGGLTAALLARGCTVVGIERDEALHELLRHQFAGRDFALVGGDALDLDWAALVAPWVALGKRVRIAGNIPYYITSPLLAKALSPPLPVSVTYLVQREVAERVVAPAGHDDYGALSVGIQAVANATRAFTIGKGAFSPPPKVDSAVLHLTPREVPLVPQEQLYAFRRLVTSLFSYRRKRMQNALRLATGVSLDEAGRILGVARIDPEVRPEVVDPESFVRLLSALGPER